MDYLPHPWPVAYAIPHCWGLAYNCIQIYLLALLVVHGNSTAWSGRCFLFTAPLEMLDHPVQQEGSVALECLAVCQKDSAEHQKPEKTMGGGRLVDPTRCRLREAKSLLVVRDEDHLD